VARPTRAYPTARRKQVPKHDHPGRPAQRA
jgi:hypothetical protein